MASPNIQSYEIPSSQSPLTQGSIKQYPRFGLGPVAEPAILLRRKMSLKSMGTVKDSHSEVPSVFSSHAPNDRLRWGSAFCFVLWAIIAVILLPSVIIMTSACIWSEEVSVRQPIQSIITPIPCHSHNDYWRAWPLFSALNVGCVGVEADVWVYNNELYVAHNRGSMKPGHTLDALYINPLVLLLNAKNSRDTSLPPRGLYDSDPTQTLVLLIDFKSDPETTWSLLTKKMEPLRQRGWLSKVENGRMVVGPVTVVTTGDLPFTALQGPDPDLKDIFLDAPVLKLSSNLYKAPETHWTSASFSRAIGLDWRGQIGSSELKKIRKQVQEAHSRGLKIRYWDLPSWPIHFRDHVWSILLEEGVDLLGVDHLDASLDHIHAMNETDS